MLFRIILMRHGQAASMHQKGDFFRPLTSSGCRQTEETAKSIMAMNWLPQYILCSEAVRTVQTREQVQGVFSKPIGFETKASLYLGDLRHIMSAIRNMESQAFDCMMLIGHNPGWSMAISALSGCSIRLDVAEAGLLSVEADSWEEALQLQGLWSLEQLIRRTI